MTEITALQFADHHPVVACVAIVFALPVVVLLICVFFGVTIQRGDRS